MSVPGSVDLNIEHYNMDEILGLFELSSQQRITLPDIKKAKKFALRMHPDKSKKVADYFYFYTKAFDQVLAYFQKQEQYYQQQFPNPRAEKHKVADTTEDEEPRRIRQFEGGFQQKYNPESYFHASSEDMSNIQSMEEEAFHEKFNAIFEENQMGQKIDEKKNDWFRNANPIYDVPLSGVSHKNMNQQFQNLRQQQTNTIIRRPDTRGAAYTSHIASSRLYEEDYDSEDDIFCTSDPFSKLKYDDIRKVHGDQTILNYEETPVPMYNKTKLQCEQERKNMVIPVVFEHENKKILEDRFRAKQERNHHLSCNVDRITWNNYEKSKQVLESFKLLGNGGPSHLQIGNAVASTPLQLTNHATNEIIPAQNYHQPSSQEYHTILQRNGDSMRPEIRTFLPSNNQPFTTPLLNWNSYSSNNTVPEYQECLQNQFSYQQNIAQQQMHEQAKKNLYDQKVAYFTRFPNAYHTLSQADKNLFQQQSQYYATQF